MSGVWGGARAAALQAGPAAHIQNRLHTRCFMLGRRTNMQAGAGGQEGEGLSPAALTKRRLAADFA